MTKPSRRLRPRRRPERRMKRTWLYTLFALLLVVAFVLSRISTRTGTDRAREPITPSWPPMLEFVKHGELWFLGSQGDTLARIDIEIAETDDRRELGLMYRRQLGEGRGMLFVFEHDELRAFWMKNTELSLDMIFANSRNEIVTIHKNTTPYSEESYPSHLPAQYVVEVDAGFTERHRIKVGDRVAWERR